MVNFTIIRPIDQPTGRRRLLGELKAALEDERYNTFYVVVAYAKSGPLLRLQSLIEKRRGEGLNIHAIFGLDQQGTTAQALDFALNHFNSVYVTREPNLTFHPKMYAFVGPEAAKLFIGSNNLTVGGTETNFEAGVEIDIALPADAASLQPFLDCWVELLPAACPATSVLNNALLASLILDGTVPDETIVQQNKAAAQAKKGLAPKPPKSGLAIKPPSALPRKQAVAAPAGGAAGAAAGAPVITPYGAQGLAIQIKPHHNGEIFLSVTAALQNPAFFRWPFSGLTVPKKAGNPAYPQLTPDPIVAITVYGAGLSPQLILPNYALNTVYYAKKSEIRITAAPLVEIVPDYSIMIMRGSSTPGLDYDIAIHRPDSPDFASWLAACNQTMPGGGQQPRKFGWF